MERKSRKNRRMSDGKKNKTIKSKYGESLIEVPQDREGTFEPKVVKKRQKDISGIEDMSFSYFLTTLGSNSPFLSLGISRTISPFVVFTLFG